MLFLALPSRSFYEAFWVCGRLASSLFTSRRLTSSDHIVLGGEETEAKNAMNALHVQTRSSFISLSLSLGNQLADFLERFIS
jgi:hypothetical protein